MQRFLTLLIALFSINALKSNLEQEKLFRTASRYGNSGQHARAVRHYRQLLDRYPAGMLRGEAAFNLAAEEFRMKHYRRAADLFASLPPGNPELSRNAGYNRGNALALEAFGNSEPSRRTLLLEQALACYRKSLLDNPGNADARINYEIVARALQNRQPPPAPQSAGGNGGGDQGRQGLDTELSRMILENARQEEARQMRRYFRPLPPRHENRNQPDW